jgi:hypothetical protein
MMKFMAAKLCAARARKAGGNAVAEMVETGGHFHRAGHRLSSLREASNTARPNQRGMNHLAVSAGFESAWIRTQ